MTDYQALNRKDLMSLSTISKEEVLGRPPIDYRTRDLMKTTDIDGCKPQIAGYKYTNKPVYSHNNMDIEGSQSRRLFSEYQKTSYQLKNEDIQGSKPHIIKFQTNRQGNPLQPEYKLPYTEQRPFTPTKFIEENKFSNEIKDLTKLQKLSQFRQPSKSEIQGSNPKKLYQKSSFVGNLFVKDINKPDRFQTQRTVNPLNPTYEIYLDQGYKVADIEGSKSKQRHPVDTNKISYNLITKDIELCQHGSALEQFCKTETRKDFRDTNLTQDIPGAISGSLKKGIQTQRKLNPNQPDYKYLGETHLCIQFNYRNRIQKRSYSKFDETNRIKQKQELINCKKMIGRSINDLNLYITFLIFPYYIQIQKVLYRLKSQSIIISYIFLVPSMNGRIYKEIYKIREEVLVKLNQQIIFIQLNKFNFNLQDQLEQILKLVVTNNQQIQEKFNRILTIKSFKIQMKKFSKKIQFDLQNQEQFTIQEIRDFNFFIENYLDEQNLKNYDNIKDYIEQNQILNKIQSLDILMDKQHQYLNKIIQQLQKMITVKNVNVFELFTQAIYQDNDIFKKVLIKNLQRINENLDFQTQYLFNMEKSKYNLIPQKNPFKQALKIVKQEYPYLPTCKLFKKYLGKIRKKNDECFQSILLYKEQYQQYQQSNQKNKCPIQEKKDFRISVTASSKISFQSLKDTSFASVTEKKTHKLKNNYERLSMKLDLNKSQQKYYVKRKFSRQNTIDFKTQTQVVQKSNILPLPSVQEKSFMGEYDRKYDNQYKLRSTKY